MPLIDSYGIDYTAMWTWFLVLMRVGGLLISLPGIGTKQVPIRFRGAAGIMIALSVALSGARADAPANMIDGGFMIFGEFTLGYLLGLIPALIISGLAVAGQVTTGAIGLGQANMMDPSLGANVAVLARVESLIATMIFLAIDGHHIFIKACLGTAGDIGIGMFRPDMATAEILLERLSASFELAVIVSAPILVTILVTQFVLGLITKFVPQVNIFIISLPLTIVVGFFIFGSTLPELSGQLISRFAEMEELVGVMLTP